MVNGTIMPTQSGYGFIYINISMSLSLIMKYLLIVLAMRLGSNSCCLGGLASTTTGCRHIFFGFFFWETLLCLNLTWMNPPWLL